MTAMEWAALGAVVLCALAVLPGTLGILMFTNRIAASVPGAQYIYGRAVWVFLGSLVLAVVSVVMAWRADGISLLIGAVWAVYAGICVFGFFMHTKMLFKPVRNPQFISIAEAVQRFGPDEEVVGVVDKTGKPFAFIARLARRPHIVYQPQGEAPFIMTHCILSHSSMAYALEDRFRLPEITITAALANNMVFYEKTNQCSVVQLHNQSRDKRLPLTMINTLSTKLSTWQKLYPESTIWIRNREWRDVFYLKLLARADVIDPASPVMIYPLQNPADKRQPLKSQVIGVEIGSDTKAYPLAVFADPEAVVNDEVGGIGLVIISAVNGDFIQVYDRQVGDTTLSFRAAEDTDHFTDLETGSEWSAQGRCISGAHRGRQLRAIPHYNKVFWYVWADYHPGTALFSAETGTPGQAAESATAA